MVEIDSSGNQHIKQTTRNEHMETSDQNEKQSKNMDAQKSSILKQQGNEMGGEQTAHSAKPKKIVFV